MTKSELIESLIKAHSKGMRPVAPYGADLRGADLYEANLSWANLSGAIHTHIMPINAGKSGHGALYPTHEGWRISIGCWKHKTLEEFDQLLNDESDWPEAKSEERDARRPLLQAIRNSCDAFIKQMPANLIEEHAEEFAKAQAEKDNTK